MQQQQSFKTESQGKLYLVPTPIGNLGDMTFRAVDTLKQVDLIAAEDTRNTQKLLNHFEIDTKQISFHEHNTQERIPKLVALLKEGQSIAQVSDAGMPSISDPGKELVASCVAQNITVVPLPGANAGLTGLIASGLVPQPFYFFGFLPRKKTQQIEQLQVLSQREETMIFYESPYRLKKTMLNVAAALGDDRQIVLAREITKKYEEFVRGRVGEINDWLQDNEPRGEFVLIVQGHPQEETTVAVSQDDALSVVDELIAAGQTPNSAIKQVAKQFDLNRQELYKQYHHLA
ncbi:16S rRNA (cytidine(1402)-2'-O)-methyltransferase [Paucilactobacillus sp. N302-9]